MVCLSVCLLVTTVSPAKAAEPIVMPFGMFDSRNHVLDRGPHTPYEGAILRGDDVEIFPHDDK